MSLFDATFGQGSHEAQPPEVEGVYWVPFRVPWIPGGCELRCGGPPREYDDERGLKLTLSLFLSPLTRAPALAASSLAAWEGLARKTRGRFRTGSTRTRWSPC